MELSWKSFAEGIDLIKRKENLFLKVKIRRKSSRKN